MKLKEPLNILLLFLFFIISCEEQSHLSEVQRMEIIENIELMAKQFLLELDAKKTADAMSHIDSLATFYYIFLEGDLQISRDDIAAAYKTEISFKSKWNYMNVEPLTKSLAFFHGNFEQISEDSTIENASGRLIVSAVVILRDNNWKFFKGQIYSEQIKKE